MRIAFYDEFRLGVVTGSAGTLAVVDVDELVGIALQPQQRLVRLIEQWGQLRPELDERVRSSAGVPLAQVRLRAPVPRPVQFLCATVNYIEPDMQMPAGITADNADFFLKSPLSISGPDDVVELPDVPAKIFHHEAELAAVVGPGGDNIRAGDAYEHIFGWTAAIDVSARGVGNAFYKQKSQHTFGPIGPWIVTRDEIADPQDLGIQLRVNGQLRHDFRTSAMLHKIPRLIEIASKTSGLVTGDLIATGTNHAGMGPMQDGDEIVLSIEQVGDLRVTVRDERGRTWPVPAAG